MTLNITFSVFKPELRVHCHPFFVVDFKLFFKYPSSIRIQIIRNDFGTGWEQFILKSLNPGISRDEWSREDH